MKDRDGDKRGGSEWESTKKFSKNPAYVPKSLPTGSTRTCQDHVVTTDLLTLGTCLEQNPQKQIDQIHENLAEAKPTHCLPDRNRCHRVSETGATGFQKPVPLSSAKAERKHRNRCHRVSQKSTPLTKPVPPGFPRHLGKIFSQIDLSTRTTI